MSESSTLIGYSGRTIGREELALVPTPPATETHRPVPHHEIVQALIETLGFRHIGVAHDEYAVSPDGMKAFGVLGLATEMEGCRFSIGLRNSHDKSMRLAMTCGYRVFVCSNMAFAGDFTPVLAKHSKSFSLIDCISVGVDRSATASRWPHVNVHEESPVRAIVKSRTKQFSASKGRNEVIEYRCKSCRRLDTHHLRAASRQSADCPSSRFKTDSRMLFRFLNWSTTD
jgi:hypothetical protein